MKNSSILKILISFVIFLVFIHCSVAEDEIEISNTGENIVNNTLRKSFKEYKIVQIDTKILYNQIKDLKVGEQVTLKIPAGDGKDFEVLMTKNNLLENNIGVANSPEENAPIKPLNIVSLTGTSTIAKSIVNFSSLTIGNDFISGVIANDENDGEYYIEPIALYTQDFNDKRYIVYNTKDVTALMPGCATPSNLIDSKVSEQITNSTLSSKAGARWRLQIAVHADYEAYQYHGNSDYLTALVIIARVNDAKRYYAWYFNMDIIFGQSILVFNNPNNALYYPTSYNIQNLLVQTQNFWNYFLPNTTNQRDIVMLYSGKPITDYAGWAYTNTICNNPSRAYLSVISRYPANKLQIIMAHEIGHSFGCEHDNSSERSIMHSVSHDRTDKIFTTNSVNAVNFHLWVSGSCLNN